MKKIKQVIFQSPSFRSLNEFVDNLTRNQPVVLRGVAGSLLSLVAANVFERRNSQVLLVSSDSERSEKFCDDCRLLLGEEKVQLFGTKPRREVQSLDMASPVAHIETLKSLAAGEIKLVVASPESIAGSVPPKERFMETIVEVKTGEEKPFQQFIDRLREIGFEEKEFVESYGDLAVRGGIVDVFPFAGENPVRIEFFGDTVESIREFDVLSQRSIRELQTASIVPPPSADSADFTDESQKSDSAGRERKSPSSLFDYLHSDATVILDEPAMIEQEINEYFKEDGRLSFQYDEVFRRATSFPLIVSTFFAKASMPLAGEDSSIDFSSAAQPSFHGEVGLVVDKIDKLSSDGYAVYLTSDTKEEADRLNELIEETLTEPEYPSRFISQESDTELPSPARTSSRPKLSTINFGLSTETLHSGFIFHPAKLAVFTEHEIFGRLKRRGIGRRRRFKGFTQRELQQLRPGDFVVHVDHGIGTFTGLTKINVGGVEQEVIKLLFLENDVLYVNLNFIDRVQKYSSQEGHAPKISKLGGEDWERIKARAKRRIKDIARDLIAIYARRKHERGFAFSEDTHWQRELEASFVYEDTTDQSAATLDVKRDMESSSPMDRLICGDVGFGKTEVAVRAAFKAIMDGKQVVLLVPTTILAMQHSNTFRDRLARYSVRVENLTRFKSTKEQKKVVEHLKEGTVDVIIGTHRLLSKDIALKDIGLLIIDEEHRFGVAAKEKLRKLKSTVDTLALTATPIPRTLHFSLIGARDLSLITTPPRNRLAISTELIPADFMDKPSSTGRRGHWQFIREAILRELRRSGQVYFVHDRIHDIDTIATQIQTHLPEARVHVAHGRMRGHQLEKVMLDFLEKKYDVLVCTKIIESGIDIPSVNTIIVNRADRFGLAELYQLRGRVGRSNVQAYAYLLVPPLTVLPKATLRRLQAIEEFTELGSGFNLAMRDLEIRGAGNLLGAEQSGFIMEMGFEMYERIVREAVDELKRDEFAEVFDANPQSPIRNLQSPPERRAGAILNPQSIEAVVESDIEAIIPDFYIESDSERLDIYRRLYRAVTGEGLKTMREELRDRFGDYPEEVENLFLLVELRLAAALGGFPKISLKENRLTVMLPDDSNQQFYGTGENDDSPFQHMMKKIARGDIKNVQLAQQGKGLVLQFVGFSNDNSENRLREAKLRLQEICATPSTA